MGADTDGHTDMTLEELEENNFFMKLVTGDADPGEITLDDLKKFRDKYLGYAGDFWSKSVNIRVIERDVFSQGVTPFADAYMKYFKECMKAARAFHEVITRKEQELNG